MKRKCEDCEYWETNFYLEPQDRGMCHRYPPNWYDEDNNLDHFPVIKKDYWCGEFKKSNMVTIPIGPTCAGETLEFGNPKMKETKRPFIKKKLKEENAMADKTDLELIRACDRAIETLNKDLKTTIADLEKLKEKNEWLKKENDRLSRLVRQFNLEEGK